MFDFLKPLFTSRTIRLALELKRINALYDVDRAKWRAERIRLYRMAG